MSQSIKKNCYDYIKNNSYIKLDDGSHIELSDLVVMHYKITMSYIFLKKNLATERPVAKTLIEYNNNNLIKNDEVEK